VQPPPPEPEVAVLAPKPAFGARVDARVDDEAEVNDDKAEFGLLGVGPPEVVQRTRVIGRPWRWIVR
jgi:hypothetical protein